MGLLGKAELDDKQLAALLARLDSFEVNFGRLVDWLSTVRVRLKLGNFLSVEIGQ